ncbi:MAG TPA: PQQ-binding-like beta-propeller repeat protein [Sedimentisphaerales bacterium]|nr:PQQ-binding-like beta-propeller repeat protein [Sedimentisphaerales bacterium]HQI28226.1 PQQ-binding-like beta-propeller repeat protein [Sedimentisphaerales bacterium]
MGRWVEHTGESGTNPEIVFALVFAVCASANGNHWPRFRGPNGQGFSDDKTIPVKWSDQEVRWKIALPGGGHSSPVVWGKAVILSHEQDQVNGGELSVWSAVDRVSGGILWQHRLLGTVNASYSTPCVFGEKENEYLLFVSLYGVAGVDAATGEILWKTPGVLPARVVSSPVFAGKKIVANCGEGGRGICMTVVTPRLMIRALAQRSTALMGCLPDFLR